VRPDVIHSHFVSTTLVARLALGRTHTVPRIFQVPGPLHLEHGPSRRLDLATAGAGDHWIGTCRWTEAEYLRRGVPRARVFHSHYGIEPARWRLPRSGGFRRERGIAATAPLAGMVAYMYRPRWALGHRRGVKGHEDFLDACARVARACGGARAVVVGGPWAGAVRYERRLWARARAVCGPAIDFAGVRADVPAVYADLDVAVHPSLSENCGGAVESLAAACPTVATAVGGLPDVVVDGETGWLVPPRDPERLAAAILEAFADPVEARRRARAGQELVARLFSVERTAAEVAAIYEKVTA
jgi:glycosyltransferase involved in cell wall biosynthesis